MASLISTFRCVVRPRWIRAAACCACTLAASHAALGIEVGVIGADGLPGANGTPTSGAGGAGGSGAAAAAFAGPNMDSRNLASAQGGAGGTGGRGSDGSFFGFSGGAGGRGGDAEATAVSSPPGMAAMSEAIAVGGAGGLGGNGGFGTRGSAPGGIGGQGGNATAMSFATASGMGMQGDAFAMATATGGRGGSGQSSSSGGSGGAGGAAAVEASATAERSASITVDLRGGNGGSGRLSGGHGSSVSLTSAQVSGSANETLRFTLRATGGNGGGASNTALLSEPGAAGNGGNAVIDFSKVDSTASLLFAHAVANGGATGLASGNLSPQVQGRVGDATASLNLTSTRALTSVEVLSVAAGGNASFFTLLGGNADARASANSLHIARATATAGTTGGRDATSLSRANGTDSNASATGDVRRAFTSNYGTDRITTDAAGQNRTAEVRGGASALTGTGMRAQDPDLPDLAGGTNGVNAFSFGYGASSAGWLQGQLSANPGVANAIAGPGWQVAGVGAMGVVGADFGNAALGVQRYTASAEFTVSAPPQAGGYNVAIGFLGFSGFSGGSAADIGFSLDSLGSNVLTRSFATLASAQAFFSDESFALVNPTGSIRLKMTLTMNTTSNQAAGFDYLVAISPVPEPSQGLMLLAGLALLACCLSKAPVRATRL